MVLFGSVYVFALVRRSVQGKVIIIIRVRVSVRLGLVLRLQFVLQRMLLDQHMVSCLLFHKKTTTQY